MLEHSGSLMVVGSAAGFRLRDVGVAMKSPKWWGFGVLACGGVLGFALGGAVGLAIACGCLVVGLVLFVASEALGTSRKPADANTAAPSPTHILVLLKEVHIRPQRAGKFQEISDPNQPNLQFEIFVHCWLVNDTDERQGIAGFRLSLTKPGGASVPLERIGGDLEKWRLGRLRDELDTFGVRYLQAAQEPMSELSTEEPLEGGSTRQGWVHLRAEGLTPAEMKDARLELEVIDSHRGSHVGEVKGPHSIPGRVWPFRAEPSPDTVTLAAAAETRHPSLNSTNAISPPA
jgi:hypothetical protein